MRPIIGILTALLVLGIGYPAPDPGTMPKVGGTGGSHRTKAECPSGEFAIGLNHRCGTYVNSIQLVCGKFSEGKVVYTRMTDYVGATGGTGASGKLCTKDTVHTLETTKYTGAITKIGARGDVYADSISYLECSPFDFAVSPPKLKPADDYITFMYALGCTPLGGFNVDPVCPSGEVLYKIDVKYGFWIDSWQGTCRKP
jgi:hypothetical protein